MKKQSTNLDFISVQVTDMEKSKTFYQEVLGFELSAYSNPEATVFKNHAGAIFAIRQPLMDLSKFDTLGAGVSIWFGWKEDVRNTYAKFKEKGVTIIKEPFDTPFGRALALADPDGYTITLHETE